jgi:hypothetical protein
MSPKLPVGTAKRDLSRRCAERHGGGEIIDHLGHDPRPVDGVDAGQHLVAEAMVVEHRLHEVLAIVEGAVDGDGMDVGRAVVVICRAAPRNPAMRKQDEDIDDRAPEGVDRSAAGIARGRADDGGALGRACQHMVHQPREQLHRHVLEGERRPWNSSSTN